MTVQKSVMAAGNRVASWLYGRSNGKIGGSARGVPVLILTVPGRKTGEPRSVPVAYFDHEDGYLIAATAGGSPRDPEWIQNLRATSRAQVRIGDASHQVEVRVVDGDGERDELWNEVVVARAPAFEKYVDKSGRKIPIAILTPVG